jgi:hypothetical protein
MSRSLIAVVLVAAWTFAGCTGIQGGSEPSDDSTESTTEPESALVIP